MSAYTAKHLQHYQHPPTLCQNLPKLFIFLQYVNYWPHLTTLCQHLPILSTHTHTVPTSVKTMPTSADTMPKFADTFCSHYAIICQLFQHMLTLVVNDCPLSLMYLNIVVILTWIVPSLHKVCRKELHEVRCLYTNTYLLIKFWHLTMF